MKIRAGTWTRLGLVLLGVAAVAWRPSWAQNFPGPLMNLTGGGIVPLPPPPPQGAWGEVIMANNKWLVIQNQQGQQFPIAASAINQFLIRWPSRLANLSNQSWIEAIGTDMGSNTLSTDHIDVYEGSDRTLVTPTYKSVLPTNTVVTTIDPTFNRFQHMWDVPSQNSLYGWAYPINPGGNGIPGQLYVVGNALNNFTPLRLGIPGNNIATVLPGAAGNLSITQVTRGTTSFAQKGDFVFLRPVEVTPKSLVLSQVVLYKKIPLSQYAP